ncbi:MAG: hypothetical protein Q3994_06405 [Prevotella sp.]|nr:hypothetical protein [Prevotella sp.]
MRGKFKCEMLKAIRKNIAEINGIKYDPEPCTHKGECLGTCHKCEQETTCLMEELRSKEAYGSPIRIDTQSLEELYDITLQEFEPLNINDDDNHDVIGDISVPELPPSIPAPLEGYVAEWDDDELRGRIR